MRTLIFILTLSMAACVSSQPSNTECPSRAWLKGTVESHLSRFEEIKPRYLKVIDIDTVPAAARSGVLAWIDDQVRRISEQRVPGDELWHFREEKCTGCHWYREGFALIRDCNVVSEITLADDM
jgi:hypothetical protein